MQHRSDAIDGYARTLLRLSYISGEKGIAEEIREIAYALLSLRKKGDDERER
jgi:hypothetical protein